MWHPQSTNAQRLFNYTLKIDNVSSQNRMDERLLKKIRKSLCTNKIAQFETDMFSIGSKRFGKITKKGF